MKVVYTDVLVIGGGLAGLRMAIAAKRRGHDAIILSLVPPKRSHSKAAQGGMQASLANVIKGQGDNEDVHFEDTVRGSDWGADQDVVRMFVNTAPKAVRELAAWGVPWSRVRRGDRTVIINGQKVTITERDEAHGTVAQRDFGGTKKWRTCYVSDGTGHAMLQAVGDQAIGSGIPVHERAEALALIHDGGRCYGAVVRDLIDGELTAYVAKATALATGGAGRLYRVTTNAVICEGIGHALALETGVGGARQHGGRAVPPHRHLPGRHPRDRGLPRRRRPAEGRGRPPLHARLRAREEGARVARRRVAADGGAHPQGQGRQEPLRRPHLARHHAAGREAHQVQPARGLRDLPSLPRRRPDQGPGRRAPGAALHDGRRAHAAHRREPDASGLFAAGEAACWDMHGFNRLGGNSVAETVVAGMIVGEFIADFCDDPKNEFNLPTGVVREYVEREQAKLDALVSSRGTEDASALKARMQEIMTAKVGIFRTGKDLEEAVAELQQLLQRSRNIGLRAHSPGANPELVTAYRVQRMLKLALTVAYGALVRTESRGAHYREDYPRRNDADWLKRTLATWKDGESLPTLGYEPLDVKKMELPPGWRGYGAKDYVDHPDTPGRQAEVEALKQKHAGDRFALQRALLPYEDLLPARLRGRNERLDEPLAGAGRAA